MVRPFEKYFKHFREHTFLQNPLVPEQIRSSTSKVQVITSQKYIDISEHDKRPEQTDVEVYQPMDTVRGATSDEIRAWFAHKQDAILRFDNLQGAFCCYSDAKLQTEFENKIKAAFKKGKYRQQG